MSSAVCGVMCGIPYMELRTDAQSVRNDELRRTREIAGHNRAAAALLDVDPFELHCIVRCVGRRLREPA